MSHWFMMVFHAQVLLCSKAEKIKVGYERYAYFMTAVKVFIHYGMLKQQLLNLGYKDCSGSGYIWICSIHVHWI